MAKKDPLRDYLKDACDFSGGTLPLVVRVYSEAAANAAKECLKGIKNNKLISIQTFPLERVGDVPGFLGGDAPIAAMGSTPVTPDTHQSEVDDLV